MPLLLLHILLFLAGLVSVIYTMVSAIKTFVLPRSAPDQITRAVFVLMRRAFEWWMRRYKTYEQRDGLMALYAPFSLLMLPAVWLIIIALGYAVMFWALGAPSPFDALKLSGSSLLTLGFAVPDTRPATLLAFSEASLGPMMLALLIAYLPTMYAAFARREASVNMLEVRAGTPPSAIELLLRYARNQGLDQLPALWRTWEQWFVDIDESHTSLPALVFFRSPQPHHSWVTAAGTVLDAAALFNSTLDYPRGIDGPLCIRAGYLALRHIADFFGVSYKADVGPGDPISITRAEFDEAYDRLAAQGLPLRPDRDECWRDFHGWRVNYDHVLLVLASLTMAPSAPWSSDRAPAFRPVPVFLQRRRG
jgi:hypothetical protein